MSEHPIIFQGWGVRAILAGPKTQTRRGTGLKFVNRRPDAWCKVEFPVPGRPRIARFHEEGDPACEEASCPYGVPGDRLWVRETWCPMGHEGIPPRDISHDIQIIYRADGIEGAAWRPSIFMPRWASRITLEITDIRVQRVREITEEDMKAEGCPTPSDWQVNGKRRTTFGTLWDSINAKRGYGWDTNPWVWAISFKREKGGEA